ncbi:tRNA-binding protein [Gilvibacter sp. SZ-19]|uniref:tRNA-binding protein n=1 Tax=Gilvibacter sp. SZ-19 TaxID=754429 RepID=UPI000B3C9465|nr:tRNA-binding protein [Gilvibacter sp. SZ-19]ARV12837.1 tRNA-binding protein [Gilvibacter sp. SZ-19]
MDLSWNDFTKVDMRVGTVVKVENFPEARNPAYKLWIDFGALGTLKSSAQITVKYNKEELLGAQVVAVVNFPEKQIGPFMSQCLVLGAVDGKAVTLLSPNKEVPNGLRIA